jgi:hypothetical protein
VTARPSSYPDSPGAGHAALVNDIDRDLGDLPGADAGATRSRQDIESGSW